MRPRLTLRTGRWLIGALLALAAPSAALAGPVDAGQGAFHLARIHASLPAGTAARDAGVMGAGAIIARAIRESHGRADAGSRASDAVDPTALKIDWATWPSGTTNEEGSAISARAADDPNTNIFSIFHRGSYQTHNMQGGYAQDAQLNLNGAGDTSQAFWLGSSFSAASDASAWVDDAVTNLKGQGYDSQGCFVAGAPSCRLFVLPIPIPPGGIVDLAYAIWSQGSVTGELLVLGASSILELNQNTVGHDLQSLLTAANNTLVAASGVTPSSTATSSDTAPPTITSDGVRVYHDVRGKLVRTTAVRLHELTFIQARFHVSSIGVYSASGGLQLYVPRSTLRLTRGGKTLYDGGADLDVAQDGSLFFGSQGTVDDKSALGRVTARFSMTLSSASASGSSSFTVKNALPVCKKGSTLKGGKCVKAK